MNLGFIGGGKMAQALAKGFIAAGLTKGNKIIASCAPTDTLSVDTFKGFGAKVTFDHRDIVTGSDVTIIAVKPNIVEVALKAIRPVLSDKTLLLCLAMGFTIQRLEKNLPDGSRVIRVMPNTPALVRQAATVFACGTNTTKEDAEITKKLFDSVGICEQVPEYFFDPVTALSGSGPAYIFTVIEALSDGGVRMGLPRDLAYKLAAQTVVGAGRMVLETHSHPGVLKDNVASPGGSTCEGLYELEKGGVRAAFIKAIEQAARRCKEVSKTNT